MDRYTEEDLRHQILCFLRDFKELMGQGRFRPMPHDKNRFALGHYGLNYRQREEIILSLSIEDYFSGPKPDGYKPGVYYEFGTFIENKEVYIKLKIVVYDNGEELAVCFSFHPPEFPMKYPFRRI